MMDRLSQLKKMLMMLILLGAITVSSNFAHAWTRTGHDRVAEIAWERLTPEAQNLVYKVLTSGVDTPGTPCDEKSFINLSNPKDVFVGSAHWADCARKYTQLPEAQVMHADKTQLCPGVNIPTTCKSKRCATEALNNALDQFRNPQTPIRTRRIALKMMIHLMADLHQPLHAAQAADPIHNGGTMRVITSPTANPMTMHEFWDRMPALSASVSGAEARSASITLPVETLPQWNGTVDKWVDETVSQAAEHVYYPPLKEAMCNPSLMKDPILVTPAYMAQAKAFADYKVLQAGVRLARVINRIAAGGYAVSMDTPKTNPKK